LGFSPRDCEQLTVMEMSKKHWAKALEWVERGLKIAPVRNWHNEASYSLDRFRPEILRKLGRTADALALAWSSFQAVPNDQSYEALMRYVPKGEKAGWRERALVVAENGNLEVFIDLCVKTREWQRLAARVLTAEPIVLEGISHCCTEPAANGLAKKDPGMAAKLYQALGMRILNAGKSKYYGSALGHFRKACRLYRQADQAPEWQALVEAVRAAHSRKLGFLSGFERIVSRRS
jgi:uncharacterized Zn finger protein